MPTYEFRCRTCGETFAESRPMSDSNAPASCPRGHGDTRRLLAFAGVNLSRGSGGAESTTNAGRCCGGSCGCG